MTSPNFSTFSPAARNTVLGMRLCWRVKAIRWRLLFLGLETAFEDAMISLIIASYAVKVGTRTLPSILTLN